ncbi:hypothetical protein [Actinoallomurus soli]|uniref:hypothetical protein n=1 Tax=Actinoallomurus soli TaxID=2952535 RepID=UPI00209230A7|nr:hypothetical protein [Actinoallomurus soli]MCO5972535.1 hypothetical protein [Actinoallomurus soli]
MKDGLRIALAVGAGYLMGRRRKMKLALTLAAAGASGRIAKNPASLVKQGTNLLNTSPEVKNLTDAVRGRLIEVGKAAAVTAASSQIDALSDRLQRRTESLLRPPRTPGGAREREEEEPYEERDVREEERYDEEPEERPRRRPTALRRPSAFRRRPRAHDVEEEESERPREAREYAEDENARPRGVRRSASRPAEPEDEYEEETDRPRREAPPSGPGRPPVRRTGR